MKNHWLTTEIALLRDRYATVKSCAELMGLFPRHTSGSVHRMARIAGLSRPRAGVVKFRPGLDRLLRLLEQDGPMTTKEMGERLGISQGGAENIKRQYRDRLRIAGWEPPAHMGKWAPKWGIANGLPDARKPFSPKGTKTGRKRHVNPFAAASGLVAVPTGQAGRVFKQSMDIDELGYSRKVAA